MWTLHTFWCTFSSWLQLLDSIFLSFELTRQIFASLNLVRINGRLFADLLEAVGFETCSFTRHVTGSGRSVGVKGWFFLSWTAPHRYIDPIYLPPIFYSKTYWRYRLILLFWISCDSTKTLMRMYQIHCLDYSRFQTIKTLITEKTKRNSFKQLFFSSGLLKP